MRVAVVGCGFMGQKHATAYKRIAGVELVAMCGVEQSNKQYIESTFQTTYFTSFDDMLAQAQPQIISICLPTYLHKEYTIKAARAGVHVICEKPIANTIADAEQMIEACKENGVRLFVAHVVRFFSSYQNIVNHINSGEVGAVGMISSRRVVAHPAEHEQSWYNDDARSGGVIMDLMIHDTDFVRSILGEVSSVYAMRTVTNKQQYAMVTYKFASGKMAHLEAMWGFPGPLTTACRVAGTKGVIRYNSETTSSIRVHKAVQAAASPYTMYDVSPMQKDAYQVQLEHFLACINEDKEPLITADDAVQALHLSLVANESARIGKPILLSTLQPQSELREEQ